MVNGDGSQVRSFCYIDDFIAGLIALVNKRCTGQIVNIGNPESISRGGSRPLASKKVGTDRRCPVWARVILSESGHNSGYVLHWFYDYGLG